MSQTASPDSCRADEQQFLEQAALHCRAHGASLTPIRRQVLRLLHGQRGGAKAYDLLAQMKQEHPGATPPTVYRALDFLIEQGLAHRIGRTNQFVACNRAHHEEACLFLVCPGCSRVTELHDDEVISVLSASLARSGHVLAGPEIEISAICAECR
jgi:Fur family zinc uptake transcriptional regulator